MSIHALLMGAVAGIAVGGRDWAGLAIALVIGALFLPITAAVSVWSHPRLTAAARHRVAVLGVVLAAACALALAAGPVRQLLALGVVGGIVGLTYAAARSKTGPRSVPTQLAAIAGITLLAPATWLLVAGATDRWVLAAPVAFGSFGGTVPYIRARVHRRRGSGLTLAARVRGGASALVWQAAVLIASAALAAAAVVAALVPIAYLPGAVKTGLGIASPERKPPIKRLGYLETAVSTVFVVLAGLGLAASP
jgi:hypothetical protein